MELHFKKSEEEIRQSCKAFFERLMQSEITLEYFYDSIRKSLNKHIERGGTFSKRVLEELRDDFIRRMDMVISKDIHHMRKRFLSIGISRDIIGKAMTEIHRDDEVFEETDY